MKLPDHETLDVLDLHAKYGLPIQAGKIGFFGAENVQKRVDFIEEEFSELKEAIAAGDFPKFMDALIDMTYVIKGTAIMAGVSPIVWRELWTAVHFANMSKVKSNIDDYHFGLVKPEGWKAPDIQGILEKHS